MDIIKIAGFALCAIIVISVVRQYRPEFAVFAVIACSVLILYFVLDSLRFAFAYIARLYDRLSFEKSYFPVILKVLAIAYITEFASELAKDAGETSVAAKVELAGKIMIFCAAIPVFISIINLIEKLIWLNDR